MEVTKKATAEWVCRDCKAVVISSEDEGEYVQDKDGDFIVVMCPQCHVDNYPFASLFSEPLSKIPN